VKLAENYPSVGKKEFESILGHIIQRVTEDTGTTRDQVPRRPTRCSTCRASMAA
jgi:hypothetical protein